VEIDPSPMPLKAIEASIESRRSKNGESEYSTRKDVVHKVLLRAIKRYAASVKLKISINYRYYQSKFEQSLGSKEIHKDDFRKKVHEFIDS